MIYTGHLALLDEWFEVVVHQACGENVADKK